MPELVITGQTKAERIASLRAQAEKWPAARQLGTLRDTMVFSTGNLDARIVFVGEAPGYQEERQCEPFVGPAGEKLDAIFKAMGFSRAEVYISNIVKFRPATASQTTNNRKPSPEEMAACLPFIRAELEIIRPECVVALGATAAEGLLGTSLPVAQLRENWHQVDGLPLRATYHPSFLLHSKSGNTDKRKVWEDMLAVMEKLGMPISEKQRGFFLPKA
jgi:DNA polymerase